MSETTKQLPSSSSRRSARRELLTLGPFDLIFADGGPHLKGTPDGARRIHAEDVDLVLGALRLGGLLVLDDLSPTEEWPQE